MDLKKVAILGILLLILVVVSQMGESSQTRWVMLPADANALGDENQVLCRGGDAAGFRYCIPVT